MKDLYKRLNIDERATQEAIRQSLAGADPSTREAAEMILLDARRRAVYDRNRTVLATIGQLRSRLALNLKPFWARGDFRDFSYAFAPGAAAPASTPPGMDPLAAALMALAPEPHKRRPRWRAIWLAATAAAVLFVLIVMLAAHFVGL